MEGNIGFKDNHEPSQTKRTCIKDMGVTGTAAGYKHKRDYSQNGNKFDETKFVFHLGNSLL